MAIYTLDQLLGKERPNLCKPCRSYMPCRNQYLDYDDTVKTCLIYAEEQREKWIEWEMAIFLAPNPEELIYKSLVSAAKTSPRNHNNVIRLQRYTDKLMLHETGELIGLALRMTEEQITKEKDKNNEQKS